MDIDLIFRVAGVGIIVAVLNQVLKGAGRDDQATITTLAGLIVVLFWIISYISDFFGAVQNLFQL